MERKKIMVQRLTLTNGQTIAVANSEVTIAAAASVRYVQHSITVAITSNDRSRCSGHATVST
jgi:hypothetical protein